MRIKHPEAAEDEVFLGNLSRTHFERINWKTKRLGLRAMDQVTGDFIPDDWGFFPVFVKATEAKETADAPASHL